MGEGHINVSRILEEEIVVAVPISMEI